MKPDTNILVIDDEPNLRQTLALILKRAGYSVVTAANALEGEQRLKNSQFDLVFLDLRMPDVNGLEFLSVIHETNSTLPVLILTAHATLESAIEAVHRGARDYLLKPIDPQHILSRVCEVISEYQLIKRRSEIVRDMQGLLKELNEIDGRLEKLPDVSQATSVNYRSRFLQSGSFLLDLHARQATINGKSIMVSPTAFDYLTTLVRHSPNAISCELLVTESQGYEASSIESQEMARWRIHELRKAVEPNPKRPMYIITVRGSGYRLVG